MASVNEIEPFAAIPAGEAADRVADLLRRYVALPQGKKDPDLMKEVARLIIDTRLDHFVGVDGEADLAGRSFAYRRWMSDIYGMATQDPQVRASLSNLLRYHVGNETRTRFTADQLADFGLQAIDLKQRGAQRQQRLMEVVALTRPGPRYDGAELAAAMDLVVTVLRRADASVVDDADRMGVAADVDDAWFLLNRLRESLLG